MFPSHCRTQATVVIDGLEGDIYIIAHAVVLVCDDGVCGN